MSEKEPLLLTSPDENALRASISSRFLSCIPLFWSSSKNTPDSDPALLYDAEPLEDESLGPIPLVNPPVGQCSLDGSEKLHKIRLLMKKFGIAVYIVPSEDEHQSEYTACADKRREYMCGFTGSAGICVVTLDDAENLSGEAALSTDGRYFLQAEQQLDSKLWRLLKQGTVGYPSWQEFSIQKANDSKFSNVISCDPKFLSLGLGQYFELAQSIRGFKFAPLAQCNLVDEVWGDERPSRSSDPVYEFGLQYSGETALSKIFRVRQYLKENEASHIIVTALDDIGWLFNLRADTDIPFSPFFFAYAIVAPKSVTLYANAEKLVNVKSYLSKIPGFIGKSYDEFYGDLANLKATIHNKDIRLILPSKYACNYALLSSLPVSVARQTIIYESAISVMKLTKNRAELFNAKVAQAKDSLVFILLGSWLEHQLLHNKKSVTEYQVAQKIFQIRERFPNFKGLSYETIASTGPNAAVIHYAPSETESSVIDVKTPFLLDSGAHFLEGTTDITRTYKFGSSGPMDLYRKLYTLVLKGHLGVALAKFPENNGTTGTILDSYARQPLWNEGLDFNHGTGHGVGSFGNVHEGPLYILTTAGGVSKQDYFKRGAILTDEPGYYVDGKYGFRVESELAICECEKSFGKTRGGNRYLGFEYLTKVPFCSNLIDINYLTRAERKWINDYHSSIKSEFGPKLLQMGEKKAYHWLMKETKPI